MKGWGEGMYGDGILHSTRACCMQFYPFPPFYIHKYHISVYTCIHAVCACILVKICFMFYFTKYAYFLIQHESEILSS